VFVSRQTEMLQARKTNHLRIGRKRGLWAMLESAFFEQCGALYRFSVVNTQARYPLPKLEPGSGVYMNRDLPGIIVIRTDANWAVSLSRYTRLIVALKQSKP
jgi:hypothetical protein